MKKNFEEGTIEAFGGSNRTESGILEGFGDIARKRRQVDSSPPANVAIFLRWD